MHLLMEAHARATKMSIERTASLSLNRWRRWWNPRFCGACIEVISYDFEVHFFPVVASKSDPGLLQAPRWREAVLEPAHFVRKNEISEG